MAFTKVTLEREGDVAILTLNDPATRNALSWDLSAELGEALDQLGRLRRDINEHRRTVGECRIRQESRRRAAKGERGAMEEPDSHTLVPALDVGDRGPR